MTDKSTCLAWMKALRKAIERSVNWFQKMTVLWIQINNFNVTKVQRNNSSFHHMGFPNLPSHLVCMHVWRRLYLEALIFEHHKYYIVRGGDTSDPRVPVVRLKVQWLILNDRVSCDDWSALFRALGLNVYR